jgi:hypothetical protein
MLESTNKTIHIILQPPKEVSLSCHVRSGGTWQPKNIKPLYVKLPSLQGVSNLFIDPPLFLGSILLFIACSILLQYPPGLAITPHSSIKHKYELLKRTIICLIDYYL